MSEIAGSTTDARAEAAAAGGAVPVASEDEFKMAGVLAVTVGHGAHDTYTGFLGPLLPLFIENLALSRTEAGLLTVFMQWPAVFQPVLGHVADRVSLRVVLILAPTVTAIAMSLMGAAPSYLALALLMLVTGLSSSALHATGPAIMGKLSGGKLGRGMGFWMVGGEAGRTLGPIAVVAALQFLGLRGMAWLMVGGPLISALLYLQLRNVDDRPVVSASQPSFRQALGSLRPLLLPLLLIVVVRAFTVASMSTYLPILLSDQGAELWFAGVSLSIFEAAGVVGALLGGTLSDRVGRRWVIFASMLVTPIFMLIFLATRGWLQFPLLLILGFTSLSVTPVLMALMQESCPDNRAMAVGVFLSLSFIVRSVVVIILGAIGDAFDMQTAFVVSAVVALLGLPTVLLLPRRQERARAAR